MPDKGCVPCCVPGLLVGRCPTAGLDTARAPNGYRRVIKGGCCLLTPHQCPGGIFPGRGRDRWVSPWGVSRSFVLLPTLPPAAWSRLLPGLHLSTCVPKLRWQGQENGKIEFQPAMCTHSSTHLHTHPHTPATEKSTFTPIPRTHSVRCV